ncbi:hypothetical protein GH714_043992 [Hevea brasiliensis]|uniref:Uncharacterized protein n=1 Tax=Hevea brasiliensis TaxID=3981 RepID=A0A6A6K1F8_HEVBR|nr:hypothetical protein GH714_043992 [Hevea brasiliensis]
MQFEDQVLRQDEKHMALVDMWRIKWTSPLTCMFYAWTCKWPLHGAANRTNALHEIVGRSWWRPREEVHGVQPMEQEFTCMDQACSVKDLEQPMWGACGVDSPSGAHRVVSPLGGPMERRQEFPPPIQMLRRLVTRENGTSPPLHSHPYGKGGETQARRIQGRRKRGKERLHSRVKTEEVQGQCLKCFRLQGPHKKRDCPKRAVVLAKGKSRNYLLHHWSSRRGVLAVLFTGFHEVNWAE